MPCESIPIRVRVDLRASHASRSARAGRRRPHRQRRHDGPDDHDGGRHDVGRCGAHRRTCAGTPRAPHRTHRPRASSIDRHAPVHDRAEHGDPEHDADVARRARDPGRHARLVARHARDGHRADRRAQHRVADADDEVRGEQPADRRVLGQERQRADARAEHEHAADEHAARPARADEVARERAADQRGHGRRQGQQARPRAPSSRARPGGRAR